MYNYENTLTGAYTPGGSSELEALKNKLREQENIIASMQQQIGAAPLTTGIQQAYQKSDRYYALIGKFADSILTKNAIIAAGFRGMPEYQHLTQEINKDFAEYEKAYIKPVQPPSPQPMTNCQQLQSVPIHQNNGGI